MKNGQIDGLDEGCVDRCVDEPMDAYGLPARWMTNCMSRKLDKGKIDGCHKDSHHVMINPRIRKPFSESKNRLSYRQPGVVREKSN
ncbi:hypothetical protein CRENBAI_010389 [Crenichthys baileyi]|uniref:Uncharacterized protein n=1 Tax=Crenichthys baileyi TaxID=28760 RepID=A0AAV9R5L7_9TELE